MSYLNLSSDLAALVYSYSDRAHYLLVDFLHSPLGCSHDCTPAASLLSQIDGLRFALSLHCKTKHCNYSADLAQTLFFILDNAKSSLERIK